MKTLKYLLPPLLLVTSTSVMAAQSADTSGFYIGAGLGTFTYDVDEEWNDDSEYGTLIEETEGNTLKVYAGYQFNKVIAIEATYTDYGDTIGNFNDYSSYFYSSTKTVEQSPTSIALAANLGYTFNNGLRPFALIGLSKLTLNSSNEFLDTDSPIAIKTGLGLSYSPVQLHGLQLRVAYEMESYFAQPYYDVDTDDEISIFSLSSLYAGLSYQF